MGHVAFEGFGNLEIEIRTDETTGQALSEAGIPLEKGRLSVKGRTAVDMAHQTLTFVPQGQPLIVPPSGPLAAIHPRHRTAKATCSLSARKTTWATRPRSAAGAGRRPDRLLKNAPDVGAPCRERLRSLTSIQRRGRGACRARSRRCPSRRRRGGWR